ncbi:BppU family phage baseplate upper protein [Veillonella sp.]|uniref:BppU family phage baseplate upper protein n=1 Tax=Veillonella sp. TaxID=1926307 RepID=UPI0029040934|nr:BppU family phage baseplate upper protein [Veillonella sp.]MDU2102711.1 hypothetical protein [Veillonella sp.]
MKKVITLAINNFRFNLDIEKDDYSPKFKVKQYDTAIFYVNLFKNNIQFSVSNETIKMFVKKSDGTIVYQEDSISIQNDTVKINVNNQALVCSGLTYAELEFKSSDGQVTSSTFVYEVKEKVGSDKAIESVTDIATLDKLKKYMEDAKKELERFKNDLSKIEDLVANKDKLEGQNKEAKENIVELGKVLEDANNISSDEGKYIVGNNIISESTNGYIQDLKLYGRSLVNVTSGELPKQGSCAFESIIATELKRELKVTQAGSCVILRKGNFKKNTEYTIVADIKYVSSVNDLSFSFHDGITNSFTIDMKSVKKVNGSDYATYVVNLNTGNADVDAVVIGYHGSLPVDSVLGVTKVLGLEGNYTQIPPSHFEGILSSGNGNGIEVSSIKSDGNLFDSSTITKGKALNTNGTDTTIVNENAYISDFIRCFKGIKYNTNRNQYGTVWNIYDKDRRFVKQHTSTKVLTADIDGFLKVHCVYTDKTPEEFMINIGDKDIDYEPFKQDKKTILFKDTDNNWKPILNFRGINENNCDTLESNNYHKFIKSIVFNNNSGWFLNDTTKTNTVQFSKILSDCEVLNNNPNVISDKFKNKFIYGLDEEGIFISRKDSSSNGAVYIRINRSKLETPDVEGFGKWLQNNNVTMLYKLNKEEVYECLDISTRAFRNKTMLSIDSGVIDPDISYYVPTGFLSADNSISEKVETLDKYSEKNTTDIDKLNSNLEQNYFNINLGSVTDFNTATKEGKHIVGSAGDIPHAPYIDPGMGIYGILEVLYKGNECIQRFTSNICKMFVRFRNYKGDWSTWNRTVSDKDFTSNIDSQGTGYQYLPNGTLIQWGTTTVNFDSVKGSAIIRYPITYKEYCKCTGNLESNDYGSYSETNAVVGGQTLSQGFCEVSDINGSSRAGKIARVTWIVIGR